MYTYNSSVRPSRRLLPVAVDVLCMSIRPVVRPIVVVCPLTVRPVVSVPVSLFICPSVPSSSLICPSHRRPKRGERAEGQRRGERVEDNGLNGQRTTDGESAKRITG